MKRVALALFLLSGIAVAAPSGNTVARLLAAWRIEDAAAEVEALVKERPDEPDTMFLDGRVRFEQGDYPGAAKRIDEAIRAAGSDAPADWRHLRDLVAGTREATRNFVEVRSPEGHFIVRHAPGKDALLVPYALAALESARREIAVHDFEAGDQLGKIIRVEIYGEVADLAKVSTLTLKEIETSGTIALCKFNRLMIVSPRALVRGYPWLDTLAHEFTHFVVSRASNNTVPIWFHEGLAKFEEQRWRRGPGGGLTPTMEHLLALALARSRRLITFDEMYPSMAKLPSQADTALAFAEVFTVVEYLFAEKGWAGVRAVVARMKEGRGDARAVAEVMGKSFDDFQRDWKTWLRGRKLKQHPGLVPSSLKFAKLPSQKGKAAAKEDDDTGDIQEERARKFARLGGMLRTQSRLAAAAVEYEKAMTVVGPHPQVASKLARTYLEMGELDKAIAAALPAYELYPDSAGAAVTLGEALLKKGDGAAAVPYFEAAIRISPFDPVPHCALAKLYADNDPAAERERSQCRALE